MRSPGHEAGCDKTAFNGGHARGLMRGLHSYDALRALTSRHGLRTWALNLPTFTSIDSEKANGRSILPLIRFRLRRCGTMERIVLKRVDSSRAAKPLASPNGLVNKLPRKDAIPPTSPRFYSNAI